MEKINLGKTNLSVSRSGFGAIPIQRLSDEDSTMLLRAAYDGGISFFDTARGYTTSERKIGLALGDARKHIIIASKSGAASGEELNSHLETSLAELGTDYIDLYQFHNPAFMPRPGDENGIYDAAVAAKKAGKIRHIGITSHRLDLAVEMVRSGLFETMQFPLSSLATDEEAALVELCREEGVGFIAMKAMAGGLIKSAKATFAYLRQFDNVVPIWGLQSLEELTEFLEYEQNPPALDDELRGIIEKDKEELAGNFCRACGYCLPCPAGINIPMAARMALLLRRMNWRNLVNDFWQENMRRISDCTACHHCSSHCPYKLDTPALLKENLAAYEKFLENCP